MVCQHDCYQQQPQYVLAQPNHNPERSGRKRRFHKAGDENLMFNTDYLLSSLALTRNLGVVDCPMVTNM